MKKIILTILAAVALTASAQELRTSYFMQTSNFRHQMNPALLDSSYVAVLLGNVGVGTTGNVGLQDFVYKYNGTADYDYTTFMHPDVSASKFLGSLSKKNRVDVYLNYNLFSTAFKAFKGVNLIELNVRSNTNVSLPKSLFSFMKEAGKNEQYHIKDIGVRSQNYLELAFGHSHRINDQWTVGGKMKFLIGAAYADLSADDLQITMTEDAWRVQGDAKLNAAILSSTIKTNEKKQDPATGRYAFKDIDDVSFSLPGFGVAFDFGATYKVLPDLTISAAITDLGFIRWKKTHSATSNGDYTFDGFQDIYAGGTHHDENKIGEQFETLGDDLEEMFNLYYDGEKKVSQALAATLNIGAEYTLPSYRNLRFGFLYTSRIHGLYSWHEGMISATVRPLRWVEATFNTAVSSTGWTAGGAVSLKAKHFNFYVATDRFFGKLSKQGIPVKNANCSITTGMTFPL